MLTNLKIKNFVLIENLELEFKEGLNILTGETGAGKSILIDAISGILGERMTTDLIRNGFDRASLEGTFDTSNLPQVAAILHESGIDCDDNILILKRELYSSGKGRCFANATQIPVAKAREISEYLLDIHGQNENQNIARSSKHRELLDNFADNNELVTKVGKLYNDIAQLKEKIDSSQMDEKEKNRKIEFLKFAVDEIDSAKLSPNEEEDLKEESLILSNAEKIFTQINESSSLLRSDSGVLSLLKKAESRLASVGEMDTNIAENLESLRTAMFSLEDTAEFLRDYQQSIDFSPERINEVEERLSLISSLKKKYGDSIQEIIEYRDKSQRELESISSSEEKIEQLKEEYKTLVKETKDTAISLSEKRTQAAKDLEIAVMKELEELNMSGTTFRVSVKREINPDGDIEHNGNVYMLYPSGLDKIEFLLSANAGAKLNKLTKAASGGEMSRIMLALKKVILSGDVVDSLIFDEVDAGISGKTAEIVGKKLKSLSKERQVMVITHLPQIAALSDNHYSVSKSQKDGLTFTDIRHLSKKDKIEEVARMLAGEKITDLSIKHAEEMVNMSESF